MSEEKKNRRFQLTDIYPVFLFVWYIIFSLSFYLQIHFRVRETLWHLGGPAIDYSSLLFDLSYLGPFTLIFLSPIVVCSYVFWISRQFKKRRLFETIIFTLLVVIPTFTFLVFSYRLSVPLLLLAFLVARLNIKVEYKRVVAGLAISVILYFFLEFGVGVYWEYYCWEKYPNFMERRVCERRIPSPLFDFLVDLYAKP